MKKVIGKGKRMKKRLYKKNIDNDKKIEERQRNDKY